MEKQLKTFEIERKFLLKNLPKVNLDREKLITQYYLKTNKDTLTERVRSVVENNENTYFYTKKEYVSGNVNEEYEIEIDQTKFLEYKKKAHKYISKSRYIINDGERDWEVDMFKNIHMIIAEVEFIANVNNVDEVNEMVNQYVIPDFIKECMVEEVSSFKNFSNQSLATSL